MRGIISILLVLSFTVINPVIAQTKAKIQTTNSNISVEASKSIYNGRECLVINIIDGKVPFNAPANRLKLLSDDKNNYKSYNLQQISPGKFVTTDSIIVEDSYFKLVVLNNNKIKDIEISFKKQ